MSKSRKMFLANSAALVNSSDSKRRWSIPKHDFFCLIISTVSILKNEDLKFSMLEYYLRGPDVHLFSKVNKLSACPSSSFSLISIFSGICSLPSCYSSSSLYGYWKESWSSSVSPFATRRQWGRKIWLVER